MNSNPKVSVIVPIYNAETYLKECLETLQKQTLKEIEILCVNDGSTDNSLNIIKEFTKKYDNFKLISKKNGGLSSARIAGLKKATAEYIGWVDADDFVALDMFEKLYKLASKDDADVSMCNYNFYPNKVISKKKWYKSFTGELTWKFVNQNTTQWNKIVRKQLLDKLDMEVLFKEIGEGSYSFVLIQANKIVSTDECLYNYRVGHTSLSSNFKKINWFIDTVGREEKKCKYVIEKKYDKYWINYFQYLYLYYSLILMIVAAYNNDKEVYKFGKKNIEQYNIFSKENEKYLLNNFSKIKILFFKYIGTKSFTILKISSKIILK